MCARLQKAREALSQAQGRQGSISALGVQLTICTKADQAAILEALEENVHCLEEEFQQVHQMLEESDSLDRTLSYESSEFFENMAVD